MRNYRLAVTLALLFVGIFSKTNAELPIQSRELQLVWVKDGYQIGIDNDPAWSWSYSGVPYSGELIVASPDYYYPPSAVTIKFHNNIKIDRGELYFKHVALSAINTAAKKIQSGQQFELADLKEGKYGQLSGYSVRFLSTTDDGVHETKIFIAKNKANQVLSLMASTLEGKLEHLSPVLQRMWGNISFIDDNKFQEN